MNKPDTASTGEAHKLTFFMRDTWPVILFLRGDLVGLFQNDELYHVYGEQKLFSYLGGFFIQAGLINFIWPANPDKILFLPTLP